MNGKEGAARDERAAIPVDQDNLQSNDTIDSAPGQPGGGCVTIRFWLGRPLQIEVEALTEDEEAALAPLVKQARALLGRAA